MSTDYSIQSGSTLIDAVSDVKLPEPVETLEADYQSLFGDRDTFLWRWIYSLFPAFTLSSVPPAAEQRVRTQKTILTMYVTILDDLVENRDDLQTLEEARRLPTAPAAIDQDRVRISADQFEFIERIWFQFEDGLKDAPRYEEFSEIFRYDIRQTTNAMHYSAVLNRNPRIANIDGARRYDAHNMVMFPYADVDLMFSPEFSCEDFGSVRDLLWDLQILARIGNWITTWKRELREGDYTAGIVVTALQEGIISPADLRQSTEDVIETISAHGIEQQFHDRWESKYRQICSRTFDTDSVDLDALVSGMETVFEYHQASRGYK